MPTEKIDENIQIKIRQLENLRKKYVFLVPIYR